MKTIYAAVPLAVAMLLAGCKGFWDPLPSTTTTTTSTTLSSGYFYVLDQTNSEIISYYIKSGTLTQVGTVSVPAAPIAITVAPNDHFLYVSTLSGSSGGIYLYTISNGSLTLANSMVAISGDPALAMQVDATNSWLVETSGTGTLNAIPIASANGLVNTGSACSSNTNHACTVTLNPTTINQLVISPDNNYVFVACGTSGTAAFTFNQGGDNPFATASYATENPVKQPSGAALSVAVDSASALLYIGESNAGTTTEGAVRVFTIGTGGALSETSGSPYASGGSGPYGILPLSGYVYVANWNGSQGNITAFSIDSTTNALTTLTNAVSTGDQPKSLVEDSTGNFILTESAGGNPYLGFYIFDTTTAGQLDFVNSSSSFAGIAVAANH